MNVSTIKPVLLGVALCFGCAFQASAVEQERVDLRSAVGLCSGTTSVGGSNLRYRPMSIDNIGTTDQFVSCALNADPLSRGSSNITVRVSNESATAATVNCVLIDGYRAGATTFATFTNKSADLAAAGGTAFITWVPADITPAPAEIFVPQVQCVLPGGTSLNYAYQFYNEDVGE